MVLFCFLLLSIFIFAHCANFWLDVPEGGYAVPHMQDYMPTKMSNSTPGGYVNVRRTPPPPLSSIFPRPPQVPPPPMEKYYATTAIFKPIKGHSNGSNTMSSKASSNLSNEHNYDDNMGTMNSQSTAPMINPYNTATVGGGGGGVGVGVGVGGMGVGVGGMNNANNADTMQFQRARTYNFRSYPDNL